LDYSKFKCKWIDPKPLCKMKDPDAVLSRISPTLCKPFGVSTEVIETRVKREGLWPPGNFGVRLKY
jgi:hypothetical protein